MIRWRSRRGFRKVAKPLLSTQPQGCKPSHTNEPATVHPRRNLSNGLSPLGKSRSQLHLTMRTRPPDLGRRLYHQTTIARRGSSCCPERIRILVHQLIAPMRRWLRRANLNTVSAVFRTGLSLLPLSIRSPLLNFSARSRRTALALIFTMPLLFLGAFLLAHTEQTPFSERWRLSLLSSSEQEQVKHDFFSNTPHADALPNEVKWYHILRKVSSLRRGLSIASCFFTKKAHVCILKVLEEEAAPRASLLGGKVLTPGNDWRIDWVTSELRALEASLAEAGDSIQVGGMYIPPVWSSSVSTASTSPPAYTVLVVDRPEVNAFSFGWSPDSFSLSSQRISPGVIVVFTGLLDNILGETAQQDSVTPAQRSHLQVLLSHELSHLVLGHTLEFHVKQNYLWPRVKSLAVDVVRTAFYPLTACLGPFFNDALFSSLSVLRFAPPSSASTSWALSCESQNMEIEADLVGLRLLAAASVDPHVALDFWQKRLRDEGLGSSHGPSLHKMRVHLHPHSADELSRRPSSGSQRTHPLNSKRVESIRNQLRIWERQGFMQAFGRV